MPGDANILPANRDVAPTPARAVEKPMSEDYRVGRREEEAPPTSGSFSLRTGRVRYLAAAGLVVVVGVLGGLMVRFGGSAGRSGTEKVQENTVFEPAVTVARIGREVGAVWEAGGRVGSPATGQALGTGSLTLRSGYAEVNFTSGAAVVVHGPATFSIHSPMKVELRRGMLTTNVPEPAHGFTVQVPGAEVVDLGTEVGVSVNAAKESHVEVFTGRAQVRLESSDGAGADRILKPSTAVELDGSGGSMADAAPEPLAFVRSGELAQLGPEVSASERWRALSREMQKDQDLLAWYSFGNLHESPELLKNESEATAGDFDGKLQNVAWAEGRFPDRPAMRFEAAGSRGLVNLPTALTSFTVAAWVEPQALNGTYTSLLMSEGTHERMDLCHVELSKTKGHPALQMSTPTPNGWDVYAFDASKLGEELNRWHLLAVVFDREKGTVSGYVDGKCMGTRPVAGRPPKLVFGAAEIGNWNSPREGERAFEGLMDDVALWKRPLRPGEIERMYDTGKPAVAK